MSLLAEESWGYLRHVNVRVMNCEGTSVGYPEKEKLMVVGGTK